MCKQVNTDTDGMIAHGFTVQGQVHVQPEHASDFAVGTKPATHLGLLAHL